MTTGVEELLFAAVRVQSMLRERGWRFCFIGGIAIQRWGNPRFTRDIDLMDWGDAEQILIRQYGTLNLAQVRIELQPLLELKGQPDAMLQLDGLVTTVKRRLQTRP